MSLDTSKLKIINSCRKRSMGNRGDRGRETDGERERGQEINTL